MSPHPELYKDLRFVLSKNDAERLGKIFDPTSEVYARKFAVSSEYKTIRSDVRRELSGLIGYDNRARDALIDAVIALWEVEYELERGEMGRSTTDTGENVGYWGRAYYKQRELMTLVTRAFDSSTWPYWFLPVLYTTSSYLRTFAIRSDNESRHLSLPANHLKDCAQYLLKAFRTCLSDRAPPEESRKLGVYKIINLLFKTYFELNTISLAKPLIRAIVAASDYMPPQHKFSKSQLVTYNYYVGVINFLEEEYTVAEAELTSAFRMCARVRGADRNRLQILTYLIPTHLITTHQLPSRALLAEYPELASLFRDISRAIKQGDLRAFEEALAANEAEFVRKRIYLTLERAREITLRNLFRKVFLLGGRNTKVPVEEFRKAMGFSQAGRDGGLRKEVEPEECECLIAGLIYKVLMKAYISREKGMVVLSGKEAFPGTGV